MADLVDPSTSQDKKLHQTLRWCDQEQWIEVTHEIVLDSGKTAYLAEKSAHKPTDADYANVCGDYNINPVNQWFISAYYYKEKYGHDGNPHVEIFLSPQRPYTIGNRPHFVYVEVARLDGTTSTTSGTAL